MAEIIFYTSLISIFYVYLGYPALIWAMGKLRPRTVFKGPYLPRVTILIAAYNEEGYIEETLKNKLALDYPRDQLAVIVVSDGSSDRTDSIVQDFEGQGVRLIRQEPRAGKTAALNLAVPQADGEIIVFSDANSIYAPDALRELVANFNDPHVGYVTGKMIYSNIDGTDVGQGCSAYMKYENFLRQQETKVGSVVGVDGGIDAVRKELYQPMNADQLPDFVLPLRVVEQGYEVIFEPNALLRENTLKTSRDEYKMRVRVALRSLWAIFEMRQLLNVKRFSFFAWQLWSHKLLRYLCFILLIAAYFSNLAMWHTHIIYKVSFILQTFAYASGLISPHLENRGFHFFRMFHYFVVLNGASLHAFLKFLSGQKQIFWTPRKG